MDIYHYYGLDVALNTQGDLRSCTARERTQQRIIRRLTTNPGDYIRHPEYGAGLGRYIGATLSPALEGEIKSLITAQILLEDSVAKTPATQITLASKLDTLTCTIIYTEAETKETVVLTFQVK